jgi:hypothetical protein
MNPSRRKMLQAAGAGWVVLVLTQLGCSDDDDESGGGTCDGAGSTSSVFGDHRHFLCVPLADLTTPPAGGKTYDSTASEGHIHQVTLSAADFPSINAGQTVTVTSTVADGHTHTFALRRA